VLCCVLICCALFVWRRLITYSTGGLKRDTDAGNENKSVNEG